MPPSLNLFHLGRGYALEVKRFGVRKTTAELKGRLEFQASPYFVIPSEIEGPLIPYSKRCLDFARHDKQLGSVV